MTDYPDYTLPIVVIGTVTVIGSVTVSGTVSISGTVTVTGSVTVSGSVSITGTVTISGDVTITSGTVTFTNTSIKVQNVEATTLAVSGTVSISGTVTVTGSVTVSGTVSISGTVTITGSVSITGTVTISGSVTITSGAVTISTSGGTNIIIDKLLQGAYTENRVTLENNGDTAGFWSITGDARRGKFFPRGCRGFIHTIYVYCKDAGVAGGTVTVYLHPHMGIGYIYSATVTVPAAGAAAWRTAALFKKWDCDSCFISAVCSSSDIQLGNDSGTPYDTWTSTDAGASWSSENYRYWFKLGIDAQTVGDLPVSGTVNNIEIPNSSSVIAGAGVAVPANTETTIASVDGSGKCEMLYFMVEAASASELTYLRVYCDGVVAFNHYCSFLNAIGVTATTQKMSLLQYGVDAQCTLLLTKLFEFKRKFEIKAICTGANQTVTGYIFPNILR